MFELQPIIVNSRRFVCTRRVAVVPSSLQIFMQRIKQPLSEFARVVLVESREILRWQVYGLNDSFKHIKQWALTDVSLTGIFLE